MAKKKTKKLRSGLPLDNSLKAKEPDDYKRWEFRVTRAKKLRKDWEDRYKVEILERFLLGDQTENDQGTVVNRMLSTAKTIVPSLIFDNPKFFTRPKAGQEEPAHERYAATGEGLLEAIAKQDNNLQKAARLSVWQTLTRIGVLKVIHDPKLERNPDAGETRYMVDAAGNPVMDPSQARPLVDPQTGQPVVDPQTGQPIPDPASLVKMELRDENGEPVIEPDEIVTDQVYRWAWVDARKMLLPDDGPDMSRWGWVGEEVEVALEEAKDDPRFKKRLRSQLKANRRFGKETKGNEKPQDPELDEETAAFCYYECYDLKKKKLYIFAEGQDFKEFLVDDDVPAGIEDHPYAILPGYTPIVSPEPSPWPLPHVLSWLPVQKEYNIRRTQTTEGAKRSARKVYYDDNTFSDADEAVKALQSSRDMEAVKLMDSGRPPVMLTDPPLPTDIYRDLGRLDFDWQVVSGQSGARLTNPDDTTATEATFVERAANIRDVDMQQAVTLWMGTAGRKMLQLIRATLDMDMFIKIRGFSDKEFTDYVEQVYGIPMEMAKIYPGLKEIFQERFGQEKWQRVTREQLQFEVEVEVVPGSTRPPNLDVERSQWLQFLNILGQAPQILLSRSLLEETARRFGGVPTRMLDELQAVAQKMVQINANQAGRNQGAGGNGADGGGTGLAGLLQSGVLGG